MIGSEKVRLTFDQALEVVNELVADKRVKVLSTNVIRSALKKRYCRVSGLTADRGLTQVGNNFYCSLGRNVKLMGLLVDYLLNRFELLWVNRENRCSKNYFFKVG